MTHNLSQVCSGGVQSGSVVYPVLSIIIVHYYPLLSMAINQDVIIIHGHCECLKQSTRWGGIYLCLTN